MFLAFAIAVMLQPVPLDAATRAKLTAIAFQACRDGDDVTLKEYFKAGLPVNAPNAKKDTLLAVAAYHGQLKAVAVILAQPQVDVESTNRMGLTALAAAAFKGHADVLDALLEKKAKVNAANGSGQTALMFAALSGKTKALEVLLKAGADASLQDSEGRTALSLARQQDAKEAMAILEKAK